MTFEENLYALLATITPRVYPDFAEVGTPRPYCTYQQIGGDVLNLVANVAPGVRNAMLQITLWSDSRKEALEVSRAIEDAMCTATVFKAARPLGAAIADFDAEIKRYGCRQDFTVWHS